MGANSSAEKRVYEFNGVRGAECLDNRQNISNDIWDVSRGLMQARTINGRKFKFSTNLTGTFYAVCIADTTMHISVNDMIVFISFKIQDKDFAVAIRRERNRLYITENTTALQLEYAVNVLHMIMQDYHEATTKW